MQAKNKAVGEEALPAPPAMRASRAMRYGGAAVRRARAELRWPLLVACHYAGARASMRAKSRGKRERGEAGRGCVRCREEAKARR